MKLASPVCLSLFLLLNCAHEEQSSAPVVDDSAYVCEDVGAPCVPQEHICAPGLFCLPRHDDPAKGVCAQVCIEAEPAKSIPCKVGWCDTYDATGVGMCRDADGLPTGLCDGVPSCAGDPCQGACGNGLACISGTCAYACVTAADCGGGQTCLGGACHAAFGLATPCIDGAPAPR